jgi:hypothetical protein
VKFASKSYEQLQEETGELQPYLSDDWRGNKILARFRQFIEGEQLTSADVAFFMSHAKSWWLLTSSEKEREFAQRVLARLGMALMKSEDEEADHG